MTPSKKDDQKNENQSKRTDEARTVRKIVGITLTALVLAIIIVGVSGYVYINSALKPVDPSDEEKREVKIPIGSSVSEISKILEKNEVIKDSRVFRFYIKFKNESGFQAGEYQFSSAITMDELISALKTGKVMKEPVLTVTIPEGKTIDQIADIYSKKTDIEKEEFLEKVNDVEYIQTLINQHPSILSEAVLDPEIRTPLEGYLFAATYQFFEESPSTTKIVEKMIKKTESIVTPMLGGIKEQGLTVHEAITMASLIENEARTKEDRKKISGVFYNRLEDDMALQTDPTVLYALGKHKDRVLHKDLEVESPYNTYQNKGLPVGPISNFAKNSLQAVVEPTSSDYFYFVAAPDGEIYYAKDFEAHKQLVDKHLN
ncbi:endolytic transglycosylase MltG [Pontibacillus yanchengensis]|uniref:Endolytic transglycosylase MltG n=1 Tax=Pontibacillus yanchengensis TaxID=462910 RepID=A0ACC7VEM2_9BACI|nr:endolytic transglycosylase MltG [Pontibacillus yanchengensis]MYL53426.1 endolytic transglycosylase MltG [Pontibacillus yanchengensis]